MKQSMNSSGSYIINIAANRPSDLAKVSRRKLVQFASLAPLVFCAPVRAQTSKNRIISVGGSITEIIYLLEAQTQLVAVDTTSLFPAEATKLAKIGYMRQLSAEGVLALRPSAVLLTSEAGPPAVIAQLRAAGVPLELMNADHSFAELVYKVRTIARVVDRVAQGEKLEEQLTLEWDKAKAVVRTTQNVQQKAKVLFILSHSGSAQVSGAGTAADAVIQLAGGINVMTGFQGYKPLTAEAVIAAAPSAILITQQGLDAMGGVDKLLAQPGLGLTPAGKLKRVISVDALQLLGFGPRLPRTISDVATRIVS